MGKKKREPVHKREIVGALIAQRKAQGTASGVRPRWGRGHMLLPSEEQQVASWYREGNMPFAEMARRLECSTTTITRTLERLGLRSAHQINQ